MTGEVAALSAALGFGISTVLARRFMTAVAPESGVLVSIAMNVTVFLMLTLGTIWSAGLPAVNPTSLVLFVLGGLAGTLVGRNLTYMSIARLGPAMSTSIRLSNVVFSLAFGLALLRELPRVWQLVGLAIVTAGLWTGVWSRERVPAPARGGTDVTGIALALGSAAAFGLGDTMRRQRRCWRTCCGLRAATQPGGHRARRSAGQTCGEARPATLWRFSCCSPLSGTRPSRSSRCSTICRCWSC